jgi:hypothetical protein
VCRSASVLRYDARMDATELSAYLWDLRAQSERLTRAITESQELLRTLGVRSQHHEELRRRLTANASLMENANTTLRDTLAGYCDVVTRAA